MPSANFDNHNLKREISEKGEKNTFEDIAYSELALVERRRDVHEGSRLGGKRNSAGHLRQDLGH